MLRSNRVAKVLTQTQCSLVETNSYVASAPKFWSGWNRKTIQFSFATLPETNIATENRPSMAIPKRKSIPTIHCQVRAVSFREGRWCSWPGSKGCCSWSSKKWTPFSHHHGSVKHGCISNRIVTCKICCHFLLNHDCLLVSTHLKNIIKSKWESSPNRGWNSKKYLRPSPSRLNLNSSMGETSPTITWNNRNHIGHLNHDYGRKTMESIMIPSPAPGGVIKPPMMTFLRHHFLGSSFRSSFRRQEGDIIIMGTTPQKTNERDIGKCLHLQ